MKHLARFLLIVFFLSLAGTARADHHLVFVHQVIELSPSSCAVVLEISDDGQDAFEATDRIEINGTELASLGAAGADAINTGGQTGAGDQILFASDSFVAETGVSADSSFADGQCALFVANAVFAFVIDDPDFGGPDTVIDSLTANSIFGFSGTAMTKDSAGGTPQFVDLSATTMEVANNAGDTAELGTPSGGGSSGGCNLAHGPAASSAAAYIILLGIAAYFFSKRYKYRP
jgi:hypothetical protein